jgi:hypothetical protein
MQGVSEKLYNGVPNVTVWRLLRKLLHLKAYKLLYVYLIVFRSMKRSILKDVLGLINVTQMQK